MKIKTLIYSILLKWKETIKQILALELEKFRAVERTLRFTVWHLKYRKGHTDADLGMVVGTSVNQLFSAMWKPVLNAVSIKIMETEN